MNNEPMKIIFVSHAASLTGAPKFIFEFAKIIATGHEVTLVSKRDGPLLDAAIENNPEGIDYLNSNNSHEVTQEGFGSKVKTAIKFIQERKPDLVYINSAASGEWVIASRKCKVKNIFHLHEMKNECMSLLLCKTVTLDVMNYVDFAIYASKDVEKDAGDFFDSQPPESTIMDYFFDCQQILGKSQIEEPLPQNARGEKINKDQPIVCGCGVACHRKGVDIFFDTACQLPHLQFLWIGQWKSPQGYHNPIAGRYEREKLKNFFICGEVTNPYFYLNLADLFVLCSREDPNPLIVIEALILGKQAVCFSKTGGRRFTLDRYGYVISGPPKVELLVSFINRLFPPPNYEPFVPNWLSLVQEAIIKDCDKKGVLAKFEQILTQIMDCPPLGPPPTG